MPLTPFLTGFIWRFAWGLLAPLANAHAGWLTWCSPRTGLAGTHNVRRDGRCVECRRKVM